MAITIHKSPVAVGHTFEFAFYIGGVPDSILQNTFNQYKRKSKYTYRQHKGGYLSVMVKIDDPLFIQLKSILKLLEKNISFSDNTQYLVITNKPFSRVKSPM